MRKPSRKTPGSGYFPNGMPYNLSGHGTRPLVVFQGLMFENKPQSSLMLQMYRFLEREYTVYSVLRKPGMPEGYSMQKMAADYAEMVRAEFSSPVDVLGISTGGSIVQWFVADYPELVRRMVIHSSAHTLREEANRLQLHVGRLWKQNKRQAAFTALMDFTLPQEGAGRFFLKLLIWIVAGLATITPPHEPGDLCVTVEAESRHAFQDRLHEIRAPALVIAGALDPFYTPVLFRETAAGIPNSKLVLYDKMGHPASGKEFEKEVLGFLVDSSL